MKKEILLINLITSIIISGFYGCKTCELPKSITQIRYFQKNLDFRKRCFSLDDFMKDLEVKLLEPELLILKDTVRFSIEYKIPCDISHLTLSTEVYLKKDTHLVQLQPKTLIGVKPCTSIGNKLGLRYQKNKDTYFFLNSNELFNSELIVELTLTDEDGHQAQTQKVLSKCCNSYIEMAEPSLIPFIWGVIRPFSSERLHYEGEMTFAYNSADIKKSSIKDFVIKELDPDFFLASQVENIKVVSYSSIEGDSAYNDTLSSRRAIEATDYLINKLKKYKELDQTQMKIETKGKGEAFEVCLKLLKSYYKDMPPGDEKNTLGKLIVRNDLKRDEFEMELKKLNFYDTYIKDTLLPQLRKGFFDIYVRTNPIGYKNLKKIKHPISYFSSEDKIKKLDDYLKSLNIHNLDVIMLVTLYPEVKWLVSEHLLKLYPDEVLFQINKGCLYLLDKNYKEAKKYFEEILRKGYENDRYSFLVPGLLNYALAYLEYLEFNDLAAKCYWEEMEIVDKRRRPMYYYTQLHDKLVWSYRSGNYDLNVPIPDYIFSNEKEYTIIEDYYSNMRMLHCLMTYQYNLLPVYINRLLKSTEKPLVGNAKFVEAFILSKKKRLTKSDKSTINTNLKEAMGLNPRMKKLIEENVNLLSLLNFSDL